MHTVQIPGSWTFDLSVRSHLTTLEALLKAFIILKYYYIFHNISFQAPLLLKIIKLNAFFGVYLGPFRVGEGNSSYSQNPGGDSAGWKGRRRKGSGAEKADFQTQSNSLLWRGKKCNFELSQKNFKDHLQRTLFYCSCLIVRVDTRDPGLPLVINVVGSREL